MYCVSPYGRPNPGRGLSAFDTFFYAILNVLVVTTMANWSDITNPLWMATTGAVCLYMVSLIFVAAFFAVNLVLVRWSPIGVAHVVRSCFCCCCFCYYDYYGYRFFVVLRCRLVVARVVTCCVGP